MEDAFNPPYGWGGKSGQIPGVSTWIFLEDVLQEVQG